MCVGTGRVFFDGAENRSCDGQVFMCKERERESGEVSGEDCMEGNCGW